MNVSWSVYLAFRSFDVPIYNTPTYLNFRKNTLHYNCFLSESWLNLLFSSLFTETILMSFKNILFVCFCSDPDFSQLSLEGKRQ